MLARLGSFVVRRRRHHAARCPVAHDRCRRVRRRRRPQPHRRRVRARRCRVGACRGGARGVVRPGPAERRPRRHRRRTATSTATDAAAGTEVTEFVAGFEHVDLAVSYWSLGDPRRCAAPTATTPSSWPTSKAPRRRRSNGPTSSSTRSSDGGRRGECRHRPGRRARRRQRRGDPHDRATTCSSPR